MAPNTYNSTTTTPTTPPKDEAREVCNLLKRTIFGIVNLIGLIITCYYISHAYEHYRIINENQATLKNPYGGLDLSYEKIGYIVAIGRAGLLGITLLTLLSVPEYFMFAFSMLLLAFEIPMACVAESTFGYLVNFAQLDLSPPVVVCSNTTMTATQWGFYTDFAAAAGRPADIICQEFVHEGAVLRASLLFSWFSLWIPFFLVAFFTALLKQNAKWSDFMLYFTGIDLSFSWAGVRTFFTPKVRLPGCGRRSSRGRSSETSTLAGEETINISEKV